MLVFVFELTGDHRYLHVLTHPFPSRRSSDRLHLIALTRPLGNDGVDIDLVLVAALGSIEARIVDQFATPYRLKQLVPVLIPGPGGIDKAIVASPATLDRKSTRLNSSH